MYHTNITEQILQHIREVCGLKRLELGCEVYIYGDVKYKRKVFDVMYDEDEKPVILTNSDQIEYLMKTPHFEIVGLPIHLEHLLYAIKNRAVIRLYSEGVLIEQNNKDTIYDLTRTVEQNLIDNTELRELIISLIK